VLTSFEKSDTWTQVAIVNGFTDVELIHLLSVKFIPLPAVLIHRSGLPHDLARVFIVSQSNELGVPQMVGSSPLEELDLRHGMWLEPHGFLHLLCRESFSPSSRFLFR
jgi:hypothetical protein